MIDTRPWVSLPSDGTVVRGVVCPICGCVVVNQAAHVQACPQPKAVHKGHPITRSID